MHKKYLVYLHSTNESLTLFGLDFIEMVESKNLSYSFVECERYMSLFYIRVLNLGLQHIMWLQISVTVKVLNSNHSRCCMHLSQLYAVDIGAINCSCGSILETSKTKKLLSQLWSQIFI